MKDVSKVRDFCLIIRSHARTHTHLLLKGYAFAVGLDTHINAECGNLLVFCLRRRLPDSGDTGPGKLG